MTEEMPEEAPEQPQRPPQPDGLGPSGQAFWLDVTGRWLFTNPIEIELLTAAARAVDTTAALEEAIATEGAMVAGSKGQPVVNPAVAEVRHQKALVAKLVAQLAIPDEVSGRPLTAKQAQAKRAAETRWGVYDGRARKVVG